MDQSHDNGDDTYDEEDDSPPPPVPLFRNLLSNSTPAINHLSAMMGDEQQLALPRGDHNRQDSQKRRKKNPTKTLPMVPSKKKPTSEEDMWVSVYLVALNVCAISFHIFCKHPYFAVKVTRCKSQM